MKKLLALAAFITLVTFIRADAQVVPAPPGTAAMVCANNASVPSPISGQFFYVQCDSSGKLITSGSGSNGMGLVGTLTPGDLIIAATTTAAQDAANVSNAYIVSPKNIDVTANVVMQGTGGAGLSNPSSAAYYWTGTITGSCANASVGCGGAINAVASRLSATSSGAGATMAYLLANVGTASQVGGASIAELDMLFNSTSGNTLGNNKAYLGLTSFVHASANDNGTGLTALTSNGGLWGNNFIVGLDSGATDWSRLNGSEIDFYVATGASVAFVDGFNLVLSSSNAIAGALENNGFTLSAQTGATGTVTCGYCFGGYQGAVNNLFAAGASLMAINTNQGTGTGIAVTNGIHLNANATFSGNAYDSPNFLVSGTGIIDTSTTTTFTPAAGHLQLGGVVTAPTLAANGEGAIYMSAGNGLIFEGQGSSNDISFLNKSGTIVLEVTTGAQGIAVPNGAANVARLNVTGATVATNGLSLPTTNTVAFYTNSLESFRITSAQLIQLTAITTDSTHTDSTLCQDTTSHGVYFGSGTLGVCLGTSSLRYKHDVVDLDVGLSQIMGLEPVSYKLNADHGDPNKTLYGFTAEQGGRVLPQLMTEDIEGRPNTFDYLGIVPVLVKAMQQQQAEIENLKERIR